MVRMCLVLSICPLGLSSHRELMWYSSGQSEIIDHCWLEKPGTSFKEKECKRGEYKERVKEAERIENIMYSFMKMEKWDMLKLFQEWKEGEDKTDWWRGWILLWYIVRTFINVITYSQYKYKMIKKKKMIKRKRHSYQYCIVQL
jgi:hypothetical protein